jgi:GT2 family glycosyltransferase
VNLSVVVPTHNRASLLAQTIPTMLDQHLAPDDYELIVVADGCTDHTRAALDPLACGRLRPLRQPWQGAAAARNTGLAAARGELVLFLDDDFLCPSHLLCAHVQAHLEYPGAVIYGPHRVTSETRWTAAHQLFNELTGEFFATLNAGQPPPAVRDHMVGPNVSGPRDLLRQAGGFDARFTPACEDVDLGFRLWREGVPFHYAPDAKAEHAYRKSARELVWRDGVAWGQGEARLLRKHADYAPYSLIGWMVLGKSWRKLARRSASATANSLQPAWSALAKVLERLPGTGNLTLMRYSLALAMLRGAVLETGSWDALRHLLEAPPERLPLAAIGSA